MRKPRPRKANESTERKITVSIPEALLQRALDFGGGNITATVRKGLELLAASKAYDDLRRMKGRVSFSIDLDEMRRDR